MSEQPSQYTAPAAELTPADIAATWLTGEPNGRSARFDVVTLAAEVERLRQQVAELQRERDTWRTPHKATLDDLHAVAEMARELARALSSDATEEDGGSSR